MFTRIAVIFLAFLAASAAAGTTIAVAVARPNWSTLSFDVDAAFWALAFLAASFSAAVVILPLFLMVVLAEGFGLRSFFLYAPGAAAVMVFAYFRAGFADRVDGIEQLPVGREMAIAAAAGIVFGFVYWLLAGRKAGVWRTSQA